MLSHTAERIVRLQELERRHPGVIKSLAELRLETNTIEQIEEIAGTVAATMKDVIQTRQRLLDIINKGGVDG